MEPFKKTDVAEALNDTFLSCSINSDFMSEFVAFIVDKLTLKMNDVTTRRVLSASNVKRSALLFENNSATEKLLNNVMFVSLP